MSLLGRPPLSFVVVPGCKPTLITVERIGDAASGVPFLACRTCRIVGHGEVTAAARKLGQFYPALVWQATSYPLSPTVTLA